jgi:CRP-like cAMP-binding protein
MGFVVVGVVWGRTEWFSALFTASAVGTVIIGFALQETIASFFAGLALITEGVYGVGDWVHVGDTEGKVVKLSRRSTQIMTRAGDVVTINNRSIGSSLVRNVSRGGGRHSETVTVSAPYDVAPNRVRDVLLQAALAAPGVLRDPPPRIRLLAYAASSIDYEVKFFTREFETLPDVRSDVMVHIWYHFQRAGIAFPYPVLEVRRLAPSATHGLVTWEAVAERLKAVPLFKDLGSGDLPVLARGAEVREYGAGETLVRQGEAGDTCYLIDQGRVVVLVADGTAERRVAELGSGDVFGEMSLLTGEQRTATVRTVADTRVIEVGAPAMRGMLEHSPDLASHLAEVVVRRKEGLTEARAHLDAAAKARLTAETRRVRDLIRVCFNLRSSKEG